MPQPSKKELSSAAEDWETRSPKTWQWLTLRLSGLVLVVFVGFHLWVLHYSDRPGSTFQDIGQKLRSPHWVVLDLGLLVLGLYHGLLGLFRVVSDWGFLGRSGERVLAYLLTLSGLAGAVLGYRILVAFLEVG